MKTVLWTSDIDKLTLNETIEKICMTGSEIVQVVPLRYYIGFNSHVLDRVLIIYK